MDYTHTDEGMVQVENIFKVFEYTGKQKVQLEAFIFQGVVETWWRTPRMADLLVCEAFRKALCKKFISDHIWV